MLAVLERVKTAALDRENRIAVSIASPAPGDLPQSIALQKERSTRLTLELNAV